MTEPPTTASRALANARAAEIARLYREGAPRAPEHGFELFELFPENAEIEMEIGFGRGLFLIQRALAAPGAHLLGLELKKKLVYQVDRRCRRLGLSRVRALAGDARTILPGVRPDASIARVFMHFPDPWWKKRHQKRRLIADDMLAHIARLLRPGGELFIQTDVEERAQEALAQLRERPEFELPEGGLLDRNPYSALSNREQRAIGDGLPIYRVLARRRPG